MEAPEDFGLNPDLVWMCPTSGCWYWMGADSGRGRGGGYGKIYRAGGWHYVHRWVLEQLRGRRIPKAHQVDHKCAVRCCCNPRHLKVVTQSTNLKLIHKRKKRRSRAW